MQKIPTPRLRVCDFQARLQHHRVSNVFTPFFCRSVRLTVCVRQLAKPLQKILSCEAFIILVEALQFYFKFATKKDNLHADICAFL